MKPKGTFGQSDDQPKASRRTPSNQTRIHLNIGSQMGLDSDGIVRLIQGETGLPASGIGYVDPRERHAFVDIDSTQAKAVVAKLNRSQLNGRRLKAKMREHSDSDSDSE